MTVDDALEEIKEKYGFTGIFNNNCKCCIVEEDALGCSDMVDENCIFGFVHRCVKCDGCWIVNETEDFFYICPSCKLAIFKKKLDTELEPKLDFCCGVCIHNNGRTCARTGYALDKEREFTSCCGVNEWHVVIKQRK